MTKAEAVISAAESQIGSPYVYGTWGKWVCTPPLRRRYANYNPEQKAITYKRCQRLRDSSQKDTCAGCKYEGKLAFDCRGFTHYCLAQAGIEITGGFVGRQWSDANWAEKGDIAAMPDLVCCVFVYKAGKWKHTGLHIGGGRIIHCSGEVKYDTVTGGANQWTHYAVPKGLYTPEEIKAAHKGGFMRTMKKGSTGEDVRELQEMLDGIGYACGTPDGVFGNLTAYAVKSFQRDNNLTVDGVVGPATWAALEKATEPEDPEPAADDHPTTDAETVTVSRDDIQAAVERLEALAQTLRGWL